MGGGRSSIVVLDPWTVSFLAFSDCYYYFLMFLMSFSFFQFNCLAHFVGA